MTARTVDETGKLLGDECDRPEPRECVHCHRQFVPAPMVQRFAAKQGHDIDKIVVCEVCLLAKIEEGEKEGVEFGDGDIPEPASVLENAG